MILQRGASARIIGWVDWYSAIMPNCSANPANFPSAQVWNSQIIANPTQLPEHMPLPVCTLDLNLIQYCKRNLLNHQIKNAPEKKWPPQRIVIHDNHQIFTLVHRFLSSVDFRFNVISSSSSSSRFLFFLVLAERAGPLLETAFEENIIIILDLPPARRSCNDSPLARSVGRPKIFSPPRDRRRLSIKFKHTTNT